MILVPNNSYGFRAILVHALLISQFSTNVEWLYEFLVFHHSLGTVISNMKIIAVTFVNIVRMLFEEISHLSEKSHRRYQDDFVNSSYIDCWHLKCLVVKKWEAGRLVASLIIRTHNQSNVRIRQPILSPGIKNMSDYIHW